MNFTLSEDHVALRDSAAVFLDKETSPASLLVPGATVAQAGYDVLWPKVVEMGWPAIVIPENYGGLGLGNLDLAMIVGEMGRTLAACPLFGTLAGSFAIESAGSEAQKAAYLSEVAAGSLKLALAVADTDGSVDGPGSDAVATADGAGWQLSGAKAFVVDALSADKIVVAAGLDGRRRFFVVDADAAGLSIDLLEWRDVTRQVCDVRFENVAAELLAGETLDAWPEVKDRLYVVLAAESAAGAAQALADAVAYAKERMAFGKPIGAFQAIKHQLADIAGACECATAAVEYAAWALDEKDARASLAAAMAQSYASEAYKDATHRNIQLHGAIGFTWEMKNHLYFKRARANAEFLGSPSQQREQIIQFLERQAA